MDKMLKIKHCSNTWDSTAHIFMEQKHYDVSLLTIHNCRALSLKNLQSESTCQNLKPLLKTISVADIMDH